MRLCGVCMLHGGVAYTESGDPARLPLLLLLLLQPLGGGIWLLCGAAAYIKRGVAASPPSLPLPMLPLLPLLLCGSGNAALWMRRPAPNTPSLGICYKSSAVRPEYNWVCDIRDCVQVTGATEGTVRAHVTQGVVNLAAGAPPWLQALESVRARSRRQVPRGCAAVQGPLYCWHWTPGMAGCAG